MRNLIAFNHKSVKSVSISLTLILIFILLPLAIFSQVLTEKNFKVIQTTRIDREMPGDDGIEGFFFNSGF